MFGLVKKLLIGLLTSIVSASNHRKCVLLSNQKFIKQPTLINLYLNEYSQELHYSPFEVKLDRYVGSCNTINGLANKEFVYKKTEDLKLSMFNMITGIYELKT